MANSSSEDKTDTLPERPTSMQPYQFEPVRQDLERVLEHHVSFEADPMWYSMGFANRTHWSARYTNGRDAAQQENQLVWIVSI